jgi:formylglycine-generating enzyme required for sulfatase activity
MIAAPWQATPALLLICLMNCMGGSVAGQEPAPGELREIMFVGKDGEECMIAFRWCPSGAMKEGDPDDPEGMPRGQVEGFWLSETEVSQQDYRIIAGAEAMELAKGYVLDRVAQPVADRPPEELTANDRRAIEEREDLEKETFADGWLPVYGIPPGDADAFCVKLSEAHDRFKTMRGRRAGFSALLFRLPAHYEWQYACRSGSEAKHFVNWPVDPQNKDVDGFKNFREYLEKKDPELYKEYQELLASFDGSESGLVELLEHPAARHDIKLRIYIERLAQTFLPVERRVRRVTDELPNAWNIRGLLGNVSEWVVVVSNPAADRANVPSPGDFAKGKVNAGYAGGYSAPSGDIPWKSLSIWHWQANSYTAKTQNRLRGQQTGIRIAMVDAVAETWFADLRMIAQQAYDGTVAADALLGGFESGMEVVGRDKEGRTIAGARVGIYGALAKARGGDMTGGSRMLQEAVAGLKESGDDFFAQLEPLLAEDDFRN